ncbi:MAG TPA: hypothetical protein VM925_01330 [Labilithrix sp.]|nr:hypothetical protein [Labilithrix sp.]
MTIEGPIDLATLDALVARAHESAKRDRGRLGTKEGREQARVFPAFEGARDATVQSTFKALHELEPSPIHVAHRDALLRWVHELLQARIAWELTIDEADAIHAPDSSLGPRAIRERETIASSSLVNPAETAPIPNDDLRSRLATFDEARRALVDAPHAAAAEIAVRRLEELASPVAAVRRELRARRFEAARRLGLEHPWALATPAKVTDLASLARGLLDATEPLAVELHKDLRRRSGAPLSPARAIDDAFGRDAREGWPAHLAVRWAEDVFRAIAPRPPRIAALPRPLGGASFLRAAHDWGFALRLASVARSVPFALARDPYPVDAYVFGGALAVAVADRVFAKRKLGLPARSADAHTRVLVRALFVALRRTAAELLSGMGDTSRPDELEEITTRVFGAPLETNLAVAWSYGGFAGSSRVDAPARLLGAVRAFGFVRGLVARFDEDWFDNPRVGSHLASIGAGPVWQAGASAPLLGGAEEASEGVQAVPTIARTFEETLG